MHCSPQGIFAPQEGSATRGIGQEPGVRNQELGTRRQEAGGRRQETGDRKSPPRGTVDKPA